MTKRINPDIIEKEGTCCPGDDAGAGYKTAVKDVLTIINREI